MVAIILGRSVVAEGGHSMHAGRVRSPATICRVDDAGIC
jgi:hypothetical protein